MDGTLLFAAANDAAAQAGSSASGPAAQTARAVFELARIQAPLDWLLPLAGMLLVTAFVVYMYRKDAVELHPALAVLLTSLRVLAFAGLLLIYLQPQWRMEEDQVIPSRTVLLVDTSLSMGLVDQDASGVPAEPTRAEQVADVLSRGPLLAELRRNHDVIVARFDEELVRLGTWRKFAPANEAHTEAGPQPPAADGAPAEPAVAWEQALAPTGRETRLGLALRRVLDEERHQPLSGIVVFSDGQHNAGVDPLEAAQLAARASVPIYTVGLGSDRPPANVRVSDVAAPARAYPGDQYGVTVYVQAQGMAGRTVTVEVLSRPASASAAEEQLEAAQQVLLGADGEVLPVRFELVPAQPGRVTLAARVVAPREDRHAADNRQEADVEIVDRQTRVLLFAGAASREYQFLRNQLRRDKDVQVDVLLQTGSEGVSQDAHRVLEEFPSSREEMFAYDCLVAFDPDWRELDAQQISLLESWVGDQAGGLIVIAGPVCMDAWVQVPPRERPDLARLRALYPVEFHQRFALLEDARYGSQEPRPLIWTREGLEAEFLWLADSLPASQAIWESFPGVYGYYGVRGPKPGATVFAYVSDPGSGQAGEKAVYMAGHFYGAGRVFYLASGEFWRLRALSEAHFERLYTRWLRHVSQGRMLRGSSRGVLLVERDRYLLGSTVEVRAQLTNARLEPLSAEAVELEVLPPDGTLQRVRLEADPARPGAYRGGFHVRQEGTYRLELPIPDSDREVLGRRIQVRLPDLERESVQRNHALLSQLAERTSGTYYLSPQAAVRGAEGTPPLWQQLRDRSRTITVSAPPVPLWDNVYVLAAICGLLSLEWLLRRLVRLA
jgi:hypothetical protein